MTFPYVGLSIGHGDPPYLWDCVAGVKKAVALGARGWDINIHVTKDGHAVPLHWGNLLMHGWVDPLGKIPIATDISQITLAEAMRCHVKGDTTHRLVPLTDLMDIVAGTDFVLCLEAKPNAALELVETWRKIKADADQRGTKILAMSIQFYGNTAASMANWEKHSKARMLAAHGALVTTMLLWRGSMGADWWPILDAVKCYASQVPSPPPGKVRLGMNAASATMYGASCTESTVKAVNAAIDAKKPEPPMVDPLFIPGAISKPLPIDHTRDPFIIPVGAVFHVAVSESDSLFDLYRSRNDGVESTGYIRRDGTIEQYRPLNVECDAQVAGNSWVTGGKRYGLTSWETQGMGPGTWTPAQIDSIKKIITWHHDHYKAPLRVNPGPTSPGFGYHRLFTAWNPDAHSCPGDDRVKQFNSVIVPWMAGGSQPKDWFDMATQADLEAAVETVLKKYLVDSVALYPEDQKYNAANPKVWGSTAWAWTLLRLDRIEKAIAKLPKT